MCKSHANKLGLVCRHFSNSDSFLYKQTSNCAICNVVFFHFLIKDYGRAEKIGSGNYKHTYFFVLALSKNMSS